MPARPGRSRSDCGLSHTACSAVEPGLACTMSMLRVLRVLRTFSLASELQLNPVQ